MTPQDDRQPTDPPLEPMEGTVRWVESGPDAIRKDPELATLIIRVGMASNALMTQHHVARTAKQRETTAARVRDTLCSLVTAAALTTEAIRLAQENMATLRRLAAEGG